MPAPPQSSTPRPTAGAGAPPLPASGEAAGIYLHVPFCSAVCPYCDFAVTVGGATAHERYRRALLREIDVVADAGGQAWGALADSVYFGGGTPSALAPEVVEEVLAALAGPLGVRRGGPAGARFFLEANPEDVDDASAAAWRRAGIATVSLGIQSFDAAALAFLGRRHDAQRGRQAVEAARRAGFDTVSIDLIYGWPGQTAERWRRDLAAAVALAPDHLSCYQLTVEPGTPFGHRRRRGDLVELPDDEQARLFRLTHELLADAGYPAYEVSSFARGEEHHSRHNSKYWRHAPYLGLGPSAHSFDGGRRRWWNERRLAPWRAAVDAGRLPRAGEEELADEQLALERLMLALRTPDGLDLAAFRQRYGIDLVAANADLLERLERQGLARLDGGRLRPTRAGLTIADGLAQDFALPLAG
ncbi:MAG TPA: radical SAM family heme chaperone HemW [Thermoanaerobaculia bacterium]|nr:radical SAM family heme chaperone HemW [Thermoanaerobaculia bacterium]